MSYWHKGRVCDVLGRRLRHLGGVAWRIGAFPLGGRDERAARAFARGAVADVAADLVAASDDLRPRGSISRSGQAPSALDRPALILAARPPSSLGEVPADPVIRRVPGSRRGAGALK